MTGSLLYVVRVWRADGFRASVRRVDDEDTRLFKDAIDLARYLDAACGAQGAPRTLPAEPGESDGVAHD